MKRLKIGFIGTGFISKVHLRVLKELSTKNMPIEIAGALTSSLLQQQSIFGRSFSSVEEMVDSGINVVYLLTPHFARTQYEKILLHNKTHCFIEKPHNQEGNRIKASDIDEICVQCGFQWRYLSFNELLKNKLKEDPVIKIIANNDSMIPFQDWKIDYKKSLGLAYEKGSHILDYCSYILGEKITNLSYTSSGIIETDDIGLTATVPRYEKLNFVIGNKSGTVEFRVSNKEQNIIKFFCESFEYHIKFETDNSIGLYEINKYGHKRLTKCDSYYPYIEESKIFIKSILETRNAGLVDFAETQATCDQIAKVVRQNIDKN